MSRFHLVVGGLNKGISSLFENLQIEISPETINYIAIASNRENTNTQLSEFIIKSSWQLNLESYSESLTSVVNNEGASSDWEK
jgi:UDP-N-acetylmuramoylalanine-D-glutamate ligase